MSTILIIEDKEGMCQMLQQTLEAEGYQVLIARDGEEGLNMFNENRADLVLADLKVPKRDGLEILQAVKEQNPLVPVIIMTAYGTIETAVRAVKEGAYDFLSKPFDPDYLLVLIGRALEKQRLQTENILFKREFAEQLKLPPIIGKSPEIMEVMDQAEKVASSNAAVLLLGESGTGKELFARTIHYLSPRREGPFVAINCAAIPKDLLESEFFGHEKGAFTGAIEKRLGKFELADKGTIFLDEIGDLDLALQAKLLRVLQGDEFERVGGTKKIKVNVRVISASNKDLQKSIATQTFREDLYYRLSVFPITIPPLRERREDIHLFVEHFIKLFSKELKKDVKEVLPEAMQLLINHPWKGNIRELENCIERAVILCEGKSIQPLHLGLEVYDYKTAAEEGAETPEGTLQEVSRTAMREAEIKAIKKALAKTGGNKWRAAEILKVSYKTLLTKIKDYGIEKPNS